MSPATVQHRQQLDLVGLAVAERVSSLLRSADPTDIDRWWTTRADQLHEVTIEGFEVAVLLASRYVTRHADSEGVEVEPVRARPDMGRVVSALQVTGPVAFKTNLVRSESVDVALDVMRTRASRSARRLAMAGARETTMATIYESPRVVGYQRVARPGACDFCSMLAGRGAVYLTRERAAEVGRSGRVRGSRMVGESYHDGCGCVPEPLYS